MLLEPVAVVLFAFVAIAAFDPAADGCDRFAVVAVADIGRIVEAVRLAAAATSDDDGPGGLDAAADLLFPLPLPGASAVFL